jgi:hypothetical protein
MIGVVKPGWGADDSIKELTVVYVQKYQSFLF